MPRNEEGEFELILGNKQLLTVFFIVVVLLGIFATMGYIVGRSTVPSPPMATNTGRSDAPEANRPLLVDPLKPSASPVTDGGSVKPSEPSPGRTTPVTEVKPPAEPKSAPVPSKKEERPAVKTETVNPGPGGPMFVEPAAGQMFLQVGAMGKADCEILVGMLRKKSFRAAITTGPSETKLYRVLVGPLKDAADVSKTRTDLEAAGFTFKDSYLRKY